MRWMLLSFVFAVPLMPTCGDSSAYRQATRSADSLVGALAVVSQQLRNSDTAAIDSAIRVFKLYAVFIRENGGDTLDMFTAASLGRYVNAGKRLSDLRKKRHEVLAAVDLAMRQLRRLSEDAGRRAIAAQPLREYLSAESAAAGKLVIAASACRRESDSTLLAFEANRYSAEQVIRAGNRGELPLVITLSSEK
jgi:hypothetical protein